MSRARIQVKPFFGLYIISRIELYTMADNTLPKSILEHSIIFTSSLQIIFTLSRSSFRAFPANFSGLWDTLVSAFSREKKHYIYIHLFESSSEYEYTYVCIKVTCEQPKNGLNTRHLFLLAGSNVLFVLLHLRLSKQPNFSVVMCRWFPRPLRTTEGFF